MDPAAAFTVMVYLLRWPWTGKTCGLQRRQ